MCIRDSFDGACRQFLFSRTEVFIGHVDTRWVQRAGPLYTCLLYTSDAADERSSVDLGGRRIIKKKTIVED